MTQELKPGLCNNLEGWEGGSRGKRDIDLYIYQSPRTEEPGRLQSTGLHRVRHD